MTDRGRTFGAIVLGLALAAITQFIGILMTGAGHGWITPFLFSPALFVLNPIAFAHMARRRKGAVAIDIVLIVIAVALDVALYTKTMAEGVEYFWRVTPFNWLWIALWSAWPVVVLARMAHTQMSLPPEGA